MTRHDITRVQHGKTRGQLDTTRVQNNVRQQKQDSTWNSSLLNQILLKIYFRNG